MGAPVIAVLERNRVAGARIARFVAAAADFAEVVLASGPEQLPAAPRLIACDIVDLPVALQTPDVPVLVWSADGAQAVRIAQSEPRVRNVLGWPSFASIPRGSEIAMVVRRLLTPDLPLPPVAQWVPWGASHGVFEVPSTADREHVVAVVVDRLRAAGVAERSAARAGEVAHELLTNALYTAPVDERGRPRFSHDRSAAIHLEAHEVPVLEVAFDGQMLVIEVTDRFGRLREDQLLASLVRGIDNQSAADGPMLDVANGGAGLGLGLVHASSVALVVEVDAGRSTRVAWLHDVELHPRDYRGLPASLHLFRTARRDLP